MFSLNKRLVSVAILSALLIAILAGVAHKGHHHDGEHPQSNCSICLFQQGVSSAVAPVTSAPLIVILVTIAVVFLYVEPLVGLRLVASTSARSPPFAYIIP